jgi:hypothetical protein
MFIGRALYSSAGKRLDAIRRPVRLAALLQGERMFGLVTLALGSTEARPRLAQPGTSLAGICSA